MNFSRKLQWAMVAACVVSAAPAWGDLIELKDGRKISGRMQRAGELMAITADDGSVINVKPEDVARVTLVSTVTPAQAADADWTLAASQLKKADTLAEIIGIHEKFLEKHPDQPITTSVQKSLEEYRKLQQQDGVRFRGKWMPRTQAEVIVRQEEEAARPAVTYYKQGRMKEAIDSAQSVLKTDDVNPTALIIGGLASYRQNNLNGARQFFARLADADPSNLLALNNAAVICFQLKREPESLQYYTKALAAMPDHRLLLDNVTEAMNSYGGSKTTAPYTDLARQFDQAETRMEAFQAKKNLYRFGSTWVAQDVYEKLTAQKRAVTDAMAQLEADNKAAIAAGQAAEQEYKQVSADYDNCANDIATLNLAITSGLQHGQDVSYLVAQRDARIITLDQLAKRKAAIQDQIAKILAMMKQFKVEAERLKAALAAVQGQQFTGVQRMMEIGDVENPPPPAALVSPPKGAGK